jgi:hypothetical protein
MNVIARIVSILFLGSLLAWGSLPASAEEMSSGSCCAGGNGGGRCTSGQMDACLHCYSHCKQAMEDRDCGRCDQAAAELRNTLKEVEQSGRPADIAEDVWKRHQQEAPVIYGMAVAGCYMQGGHCREALNEFEQAGKALRTCKDACATSQGASARLKVDLTAKVILPMCEADCRIAMGDRDGAKALLKAASEYLPGGKRESEVCPACRVDGYYQSAAVQVKQTLSSIK